MWSGRFREPLDATFDTWQRSIDFDRALLVEETRASRAHALALLDAGVLTAEEQAQINNALREIATAFAHAPREQFGTEAEDIHHFVELELTKRIGQLGLKLHTGRSRNEQIATDLRLYIREAGYGIITSLVAWASALTTQAAAAGEAVVPAYTHLQRAEPVLVAHWLLAYVEMIERDITRMEDCVERLNVCPLGSGAVAGATLALDRNIAASALSFTGPTRNSMDATSDRDFVLEYLNALTLIGMHASRFAEEITLWATAEFGFVELPERFSTGSSAMPQKKNPDLTELVRAKVGRLSGAAHTVLLTLKGLPLAYNKDLQETQEPVFAATYTAHSTLVLLGSFTAAMQLRTDRMRKACEHGYMNAMAAATYLTTKGVPFRTAHEHVGAAVRLGIQKGVELAQIPLPELQAIAPEFDVDFYDAITLDATLDCHDVVGGTARGRVAEALAATESRLRALAEEYHHNAPEPSSAGA